MSAVRHESVRTGNYGSVWLYKKRTKRHALKVAKLLTQPGERATIFLANPADPGFWRIHFGPTAD